MVAGMSPVLRDGEFVFATLAEGIEIDLSLHPLAWFREAEGVTVILDRASAAGAGFDVGLPMRQITLEVHSALDGVGLTAAVASALAGAGIPCNVVAAFHHDHVFVPTAMAETALAVLRALQDEARSQK